jgi:hypothetical protein
MPADSPTLGLGHLQFEALLTTARLSANRNDFALIAMLGLLGGTSSLGVVQPDVGVGQRPCPRIPSRYDGQPGTADDRQRLVRQPGEPTPRWLRQSWLWPPPGGRGQDSAMAFSAAVSQS